MVEVGRSAQDRIPVIVAGGGQRRFDGIAEGAVALAGKNHDRGFGLIHVGTDQVEFAVAGLVGQPAKSRDPGGQIEDRTGFEAAVSLGKQGMHGRGAGGGGSGRGPDDIQPSVGVQVRDEHAAGVNPGGDADRIAKALRESRVDNEQNKECQDGELFFHLKTFDSGKSGYASSLTWQCRDLCTGVTHVSSTNACEQDTAALMVVYSCFDSRKAVSDLPTRVPACGDEPIDCAEGSLFAIRSME